MAGAMFALPRAERYREGWSARSLRSILRSRSERNHPELPLLTVARERGVFVRSVNDANHNSIPDDLSNYKVARAGDLVINKMKAWQGSLGLAPIDGIVSPAYFVFHADFAVPQFGEYLLRSKPYVAKFGAASDGVRIGQWDLNVPRMRNIEVHLPPLDEQAAIVKYLAHANARIDKAIAAKRHLISLIEQRRRALNLEILSGRAGTADDSASWAKKRLKWVTRLQRGYDLPADARQPGPFPVVSSGGTIATHHDYRATGPGVVIGRYGSTGAVFYIEESFWPHNTALFVTDFQGNDPRWCYWLLQSIDKTVYAEKSAVPGVDRKDLYEIEVSVPPVGVQRRAVQLIEQSGAEMDSLVNRCREEISLLAEFRSRLVADVVTGQVDVRAISATLPDATDSFDNLTSAFDDDPEEALSEGEE